MKKLCVILLAVFLVLGAASYVLASGSGGSIAYNRSGSARLLIERWSEPLITNNGLKTLSTNVIAGNLILGVTYSDTAAGIGVIYDSATLVGVSTSTNVIAEVAVSAGDASTVMFPIPYQIQNGLVLQTTTITGTVIVYYE